MEQHEASPDMDRPKAAVFNDPKIRGLIYQTVLLLAVVYLAYVGIGNVSGNLRKAHIASGFGFLGNPAGFAISQSLVPYNEGVSTYFDVYLVGLLNTLLVSVLGVIAATVLGFIVGVCRLSTNLVVRGVATIYVEAFRNIPLLLHIFIWYFGVMRLLPVPRESMKLGSFALLNNRGVFVPRPILGDLSWATASAFAIGIVAWIVLSRWSATRQRRTGHRFPVLWPSLGLVILLPLLVFVLTGAPLRFDYPKLGTFQPSGGIAILPELIALFLALTSYTAAFIAEIVRAGIMSVSKGQTEAAYALGLRPSPALRLVVIPQAMRVIIPLLTSQYLSLMKNSSLAVAIAYPDLVSVFAGTALNQTGQAVEIIAMTMVTYLGISLLTSAGMSWYSAQKSWMER